MENKYTHNFAVSSSANFRAMPMVACPDPALAFESTQSSKSDRSILPLNTNQTASSKHNNKEATRKPLFEITIGWKNPSLTSMGFYHVLSPSHRRFPKAFLSEVLQGLVNIFRSLSLETTFHNTPALCATCRSLDQVELAVNLWECDKDELVMEVQRVAGDGYLYSGYMRDILSIDPRETTANTLHCNHNMHYRAEALLESLPVSESETVSAQESLELVLNMILSDRYDARCLGLQSLVIMTDPTKTKRSIATAVSQAALLGYTEIPNGDRFTDSRIQDRIFSLAFRGCWPDSFVSIEGGAQDKPHAHLALMVMANAASLIQSKAEFTTLLKDSARFAAGNSLILAMQQLVWNAQAEPHEAYLATRILSAVCQGQPDAVRNSLEPDAVRAAQHVGFLSHAALETESGQLLAALAS